MEREFSSRIIIAATSLYDALTIAGLKPHPNSIEESILAKTEMAISLRRLTGKPLDLKIKIVEAIMSVFTDARYGNNPVRLPYPLSSIENPLNLALGIIPDHITEGLKTLKHRAA